MIQEPAYLSCVFDRMTGTGCARDRRQAGSHRGRCGLWIFDPGRYWHAGRNRLCVISADDCGTACLALFQY